MKPSRTAVSRSERVALLREELRVSRVVALAQGLLMGSFGLTGEQAALQLDQLRRSRRTSPEKAAVYVLAWWSLQE